MRKMLCCAVVMCSILLSSLSASYADGVDIYTDLKTGNEYFYLLMLDFNSAINNGLEINLTNFAIDDINSYAGMFAIGLTFIYPDPSFPESVRFGSGSLVLNDSTNILMSNKGTYRADGIRTSDSSGESTDIGSIVVGGLDHNSFYLFDLSGVDFTVTSAKLKLNIEAIVSNWESQALAFAGYDVETDKTLLTAPVPEPTTMLLFGTGLAGLAGVVRRKKKD